MEIAQLILRARTKGGQNSVEESVLGNNKVAPKDLPDSYYVGQEFVEDSERVDALIHFHFRSPVEFTNINFDFGKLHVRQQENGEIFCSIERMLSKKLFETITSVAQIKAEDATLEQVNQLMSVTHFIIGYIDLYLPTINDRILQGKYLEGHILARTISISEIYGITIRDREGKRGGFILWPAPLKGFPPSKLKTNQDAVYIRDLIDAMTAYFQYNLDDCIRKVITSLENSFIHYQVKPTQQSDGFLWFRRRTKFSRQIEEYVTENHYGYSERDLKILRKNILFVYGLRNKIVHDKLRINSHQTTVCRKAIGTLLYIYQGNFINAEHRKYIFSFYGQFQLIDEQYNGTSLDRIEWLHRKPKKISEGQIIRNPDDMNKWMFQSLQISRQERSAALRGEWEQPPQGIL